MKTLVLLLFLAITTPAGALQNQLADHPSPYLAMHGEDPVAWQDWGPEAVELAREEGKLLFISSGYFSCHWCHVMQRESYRDQDIAKILNTRFVPVKLDRELHGALDGYLIDFVQQTQGSAGWPLNVFLTPEGYPLIGVTYLPPGRFRKLLLRLDATWKDERGRMRDLARRTALQLRPKQVPAESLPMDVAALRASLLAQALTAMDLMEGGFGDQSRFPMAPQLLALLELQTVAPTPELAEFLTLTLDRMADEGMRDQLAGGFFRYTVDPSWQVPHFEKMLYTQALLSEVYLRAARLFGRPDYAAVARDTLEFVMREMGGPQGAFIASFSAVDGAGVEGGVYLWTIDELHALLGEEDTALARRYWRMQDIPALDGGHLPRRGEDIARIAQLTGQDEALLKTRIEAIRTKLLAARATRMLPADRKELAGWNGLMLAAFATGAMEWGDPRLRAAATRVRDHLRNRLWDGQQLRRALSGERELGNASLEDYAYVAYGMARYADLSGDPVDRTFVAALLHFAWQHYFGADGWRMDDRPLIPGMGAESAMPEGALPAPSAVAIRLSLQSDDPALVEKAVTAARLGRRQAEQDPFWYAGHHAALLAARDRAAAGVAR
ncbi:MAG: DUF255 domain-containing protein [Sedimenticolaceae bacterium]